MVPFAPEASPVNGSHVLEGPSAPVHSARMKISTHTPPLSKPISFYSVVDYISQLVIDSGISLSPSFDQCGPCFKLAVNKKRKNLMKTPLISQEVGSQSSSDVMIMDGNNFPKRFGTKKRKHRSRTEMDVTFLRRSTRRTPSRYRGAPSPQAASALAVAVAADEAVEPEVEEPASKQKMIWAWSRSTQCL